MTVLRDRDYRRRVLVRRRSAPAVGLLGAIARWLGSGDSPPSADLLAYVHAVQPVARRAADRYAVWLECLRDLTDSEDLANAASRQRWQFANDAAWLADMQPPAEARALHQRLLKALQLAARASQLLGVGYRSTRYATVCDGQAALEDAQRALQRVVEELADWMPAAEPAPLGEQRRARADRQAS